MLYNFIVANDPTSDPVQPSEDQVSGQVGAARRKPARGAPDLEALFAEVDEQREKAALPAVQKDGFLDLMTAAPAAPGTSAPTSETEAPKPEIAPRKPRKCSDLGTLLGESPEQAAKPGVGKAARKAPEKEPRKAARKMLEKEPRKTPDLGNLFTEPPPAEKAGSEASAASLLDFALPKAAPVLADAPAPAAEVEAPQPEFAPRPRRKLPDLGNLFAEPPPAEKAGSEASAASLLDFALPKAAPVLADAPAPAAEVEAPQPEFAPRPRRKLPDLGNLFAEPPPVEKAGSEASAASLLDFARPKTAPAPAEAPAPAAVEATFATPGAARSARRPTTDLFSALDGEQKKAPPTQPAMRSASFLDLSRPTLSLDEIEEESDAQLPIPAELQEYLSPDLWRKLNSPALPRGVLFNALERVRSVLYLLSTFMPTHLVQEKMRRPVAGFVSGQMLRGCLLFSDVSGFTPLSERLAVLGPQGAERVTAIMNQYFATMLEILAWSGGVLLKFAGDALLVYFPEQENEEQVRWAVRAGQRMLRAMRNFSQIETPQGNVALQMKVGLANGEYLAASVGGEKRMEYFVFGPAVTQTMGAEGKTTGGGQLVVNALAAQALRADYAMTELEEGFALLQSQPPSPEETEKTLDDFEIKAEARRARGAIPWNASPRAILAQVEVALRQIQALRPFLPSELVDRIVVHARQRQVDSEYRPTITMFCNFTGPEILLDLWGAGGVQRITSILNAYFSSMHEVIARYGGIVSRVDPYSKGTKMLILFGAPVAHEDDPQRAVSAALAMNAELEILNETWQRKFARYLPPEWNAPFIQHRLGITLGETFAGQVGSSTRREYTVMGDDVNLAARLMGAAEMGQILIEQKIQKVVSDYFVLSALPPMKVKGKSKPIAVFQVDGPRDDTLARRAHGRGPLVGRGSELAQARQVLQQALHGSGALYTIVGPAGIGKSHMADELVNRAADQGAQVLFVQCRAYQDEMPYAAWGAFLRSLAGITSIDYNPRVHYTRLQNLLRRYDLPLALLLPLAALMGLNRTVLSQMIAEVDEEAGSARTEEDAGRGEFDFIKNGRMKRRGSSLELFQDLERQQASDAGQVWQQLSEKLSEHEREEIYTAVWELLAGLARLQPMVVFFEDAQWVDRPSRDLLRFLEERLAEIPALILLTWRGDSTDSVDFGKKLFLETLNQANTTALVAHILVSDLAQVIYEQSNGNPMFVDEITRWFKRTRNLDADELRSMMQSSNILQKLVLSGLESLPELQREIMRVASVVAIANPDAEFRTGEVQAMLSTAVDAVTLSLHLRTLAREQLIRLAEAGADARYAFMRTLVRDILYNSLPYEQRRELHARLAEYLSNAPSRRRRAQARIAAALEFGPGNPAQEFEIVAYHFEQAGQWTAAARAWLNAGKEAAGVKNAALEHYGRALACLEKLPALDAEANELKYGAALGKGNMAALTGQLLTAVGAYEAAQAAWTAKGADAPAEDGLRAACKLALTLPTQNRAAEALKILQQAFKRAPEELVAGNLAAVGTMAWLLWRAGKNDAAQWVERGRSLAQAAAATDAWAAGVAALLADLGKDWAAAQEQFKAQGNITGAALAALRCGDECLAQNKLADALVCYQQAGEFWGKSGGGQSHLQDQGGHLPAIQDAAQKSGGFSLALYQQAGVYWQMRDVEAAQRALEQALAALPQCAVELQASGRVAIQRALKMCGGAKEQRGAEEKRGKEYPKKSKPRRLAAWRWQLYDDLFRISILFRS